MRCSRVVLLLFYFAALLLQAPAGSARAPASIGATAAVGAELQVPSPSGPGAALLLESALGAPPSPAHPGAEGTLPSVLPPRGFASLVASRTSRHAPQCVPCESVPLSERLPYDATAPPASA